MLDNTNMSDFWNHQAGSQVLGTSLGVEAIQEFALLTNTYSAQFGGNGSVMNAASKSGTNDFHGSAYEFLRNSALDSRSYFETALNSTNCRFRRNQFGGSLGGPIKKNKLFFFGNYEGFRQALGQPTAGVGIPEPYIVGNGVTGQFPAVRFQGRSQVHPTLAALLSHRAHRAVRRTRFKACRWQRSDRTKRARPRRP